MERSKNRKDLNAKDINDPLVDSGHDSTNFRT